MMNTSYFPVIGRRTLTRMVAFAATMAGPSKAGSALRSFGAIGALLLAAPGMASAQQETPGQIVALDFNPENSMLLKGQPDGLYRSGDTSPEWKKIPLPPAEGEGRIAEVAVPAGPTEDVFYLAGPGYGVQRTNELGTSWEPLNEGLPSRDVVAFAAHADQPETLYAVIAEEGIYRSEDAGASWQMMDKGPKQGLRELVHSDMEGSMQSGWLFAATPDGVQRAMDCFCLWRDAGGLSGEVTAITYHPGEPSMLFAAAGDDLFRSTDGGENWEPVAGPGGTVTALTLTPAGALHAGTADGGLFRSIDEGKTWAAVHG